MLERKDYYSMNLSDSVTKKTHSYQVIYEEFEKIYMNKNTKTFYMSGPTFNPRSTNNFD